MLRVCGKHLVDGGLHYPRRASHRLVVGEGQLAGDEVAVVEPAQRQREQRQRVPAFGGVVEQLIDQIGSDVQLVTRLAGPLGRSGDNRPELVVRHGLQVVEDFRGQLGQLWRLLHHLVAVGADGARHDESQSLPIGIRLSQFSDQPQECRRLCSGVGGE